ncbi:MAG: hypothetical protein H8E66_24495 [Planctomycetes bacterium]|nr:hypothetical protein [Planctomycetota bacterium]
MNPDAEDRRWQFSLRSFLFTMLIVGPIAGVVGPIVLESITEWKPPPRPIPAGVKSSAPFPPHDDSESYYETGETPLY